jgi:hypothetical protein
VSCRLGDIVLSMIMIHFRRRLVAAVFCVGSVLTATAAAPAFASSAVCPQFEDKAKAAIDHSVHLGRITPKPVWRSGCGTLYRSDSRGPAIVFAEGFAPKDVQTGQYDIEKYVLVDKVTKTEIMNDCQDNPHYKPWH